MHTQEDIDHKTNDLINRLDTTYAAYQEGFLNRKQWARRIKQIKEQATREIAEPALHIIWRNAYKTHFLRIMQRRKGHPHKK